MHSCPRDFASFACGLHARVSIAKPAQARLPVLLNTQDALGVGVENALPDFVGEAEFVPLAQHPLVRDAWIIAAKYNFVLQAAANIFFQLRRKILRRPTG